MAKGGRIFGGVFSIIGSGIILIMAWVFWFIGFLTSLFGDVVMWAFFFLLLASGILGLIGGILLLTDKTAGGVLAIIGGAVDFVFTIAICIMLSSASPMTWIVILFYFIPPAILLTGGIVGTAVGNEFDG